MSNQEQQEEEVEVLRSIYDGDENFKEIGPTTFQYKYGEDGSHTSLIAEITWGDEYPGEPPTVNLDTFYNKHIIDSVKNRIKDGVLEQAQDFLDSAMTYSLFEWVKENYEDLVVDQSDSQTVVTKNDEKEPDIDTEVDDSSKKKIEKKEQLTKHQKRRMYEKMGNATGEKVRGYNWVDIVKHLSQTGGAIDS